MGRVLYILTPFAVCVGLLLPVAGYRHLWQDEVDTAERARSVLARGWPSILDPEGRVSVHTGGAEIEDGWAHRYQPWVPFYVGAFGLKVGRAFDWSEDRSIRSAFVAAHGATHSLLAFGLVSAAGWSPPIAALVATSTALSTPRLLYGRTARYHALLDFFFVLGLVAIGCGIRARRIFLYASIAILPHVQSFSGVLLALILLGLAFIFDRPAWRIAAAVLGVSLLALAVLTRPWHQGEWHDFIARGSILRSYFDAWILIPTVGGILLTFFEARKVLYLFALAVAGVAVLDFHSFSQPRYYLTLPLFFLFWPIANRTTRSSAHAWLWLIPILACEWLGPAPFAQGLRVVASDYRFQSEGVEQPLHQAWSRIRKSDEKARVVSDYVPQFVNWYLREARVALEPDRSLMDDLNRTHEIWAKEPLEPDWHIWYPTALNGNWRCAPNCDYASEDYTPGQKRYRIRSRALNRSFEMCIVQEWRTDRWNNAPFAQELPEAVQAEGNPRDTLVLSRRCLDGSELSALDRFSK